MSTLTRRFCGLRHSAIQNPQSKIQNSRIEIVPHARGGYGLRIAGDDVICGHYATIEDARRHADPTFQHVVVCEETAS